MSHKNSILINSTDIDHDAFYEELTLRNRHFIPASTQRRLRKLKVLVAGCGSTGGACTQSLARVGVENFALADSGAYDLSNLNRQHAYLENLGQNKAEFHAARIKGINPFASIQTHPEGINLKNVEPLAEWADIIVDAVDVTTSSGIAAKLSLHTQAHRTAKPVFTALDLGFCQYGKSYDYRHPRTRLLGGQAKAFSQARHPLKALFTLVPLGHVPAHVLPLLKDLMTDPQASASQLGATSDLLSSIIVAAMVRFAETRQVIDGWNFTLEPLARPWSERIKSRWQDLWLRREVARLLKNAP